MPKQRPLRSSQRDPSSLDEETKKRLQVGKSNIQKIYSHLITSDGIQALLEAPDNITSFKQELSAVLETIKPIATQTEVINMFTNHLEGKEIEIYQEKIDATITRFNVTLDALKWEEKKGFDAKLRIQMYETLKEGGTLLYAALQLYKA